MNDQHLPGQQSDGSATPSPAYQLTERLAPLQLPRRLPQQRQFAKGDELVSFRRRKAFECVPAFAAQIAPHCNLICSFVPSPALNSEGYKYPIKFLARPVSDVVSTFQRPVIHYSSLSSSRPPRFLVTSQNSGGLRRKFLIVFIRLGNGDSTRPGFRSRAEPGGHEGRVISIRSRLSRRLTSQHRHDDPPNEPSRQHDYAEFKQVAPHDELLSSRLLS